MKSNFTVVQLRDFAAASAGLMTKADPIFKELMKLQQKELQQEEIQSQAQR